MSLAGSPLEGRSFDAVIFDLDGTLINSHAAMLRAYGRWADEYGVDLSLLPALLGMPSAVTAERLLPPELVAAGAARIDELETTDTDGVVALPGARDALVLLGGRAAIATSCTSALMKARVAAAGLPFPEVIVTRDQVEKGKPAPDSFLLAAERLGVAPGRALVVEDAPAGVAAARAAGSAVLGVLSTKTAVELHADAHVDSLADIEWFLADDGIRLR
ncbi:HAD-IA family hydrolase [Tessaracoccus sp. OS52]|uniref:HAD family hydrolase n=1 Tax=Tessaracoccus sp. OS52 TaxID=2886691 RepID=UPI001D105F61|nr:HAD-IA family hydrolase [Tessaracoccus sp. OS52]